MAKFLLGLLVGAIVTVLAIFIVVLAVRRLFSNKQPTIPGNAVLVLTLDGDLPETAPVDVPIPLIQAQSAPTVRDVWTSLRQAASDNRVKAIVLQPSGLATGWGKLQELRQELAN